MEKKRPLTPAQKQKRYRERKAEQGKKEVRGYLSTEALTCIEDIREKTGWDDSTILSNAIRLTYAAQKCGQVKLLNSWLTKNKR